MIHGYNQAKTNQEDIDGVALLRVTVKKRVESNLVSKRLKKNLSCWSFITMGCHRALYCTACPHDQIARDKIY